MDALKEAATNNPYVASGVATVSVLATSVLAYKLLFKRKRPSLEELMKGPPDTVILFQFKKGPRAPSLSPFPLKLETYLRMAKIPYQSNTKGIMSAKGKTPWMAYNGEAVADSQFCIEYLNDKRGVNLNKHLKPAEAAVAKSFQVMADEHLYWCFGFFRYSHTDDGMKVVMDHFSVPSLVWKFLRKRIKSQIWAQGMGRHTAKEVEDILMADLRALSDYLGTKPFLMGDMPCETDCSVFGILAQFVWQQRDELLSKVIQDNFPNLHQYCLRIKEKFWPDWDEQCTSTDEKETWSY